jgi:hypothetical protein
MHKYSPHKPKGVFHRFFARLRFLLERFLLRGLSYRLLLAAMIVADEIKANSDSCLPLSKQINQMAENFDLDGIQKLADGLDAC